MPAAKLQNSSIYNMMLYNWTEFFRKSYLLSFSVLSWKTKGYKLTDIASGFVCLASSKGYWTEFCQIAGKKQPVRKIDNRYLAFLLLYHCLWGMMITFRTRKSQDATCEYYEILWNMNTYLPSTTEFQTINCFMMLQWWTKRSFIF